MDWATRMFRAVGNGLVGLKRRPTANRAMADLLCRSVFRPTNIPDPCNARPTMTLKNTGIQTCGHAHAQFFALLYKGIIPLAFTEQRLLHLLPTQTSENGL